MGVFSLIGLAYSFQFLWSPLVDKVDIRSCAGSASASSGSRRAAAARHHPDHDEPARPGSALGLFSLLAGVGAFASATQDIAINAWRIDIADEEATIDILSTVYQMGFRLSSLVGGALGLIIAARIGWPQTYVMLGLILLAIGVAGLFAPIREDGRDHRLGRRGGEALRPGELLPKVRTWGLLAVGTLWALAIGTVLVFMIRSLTAMPDDRPNPTEFTATYGPLIILATIVLPALSRPGWSSSGVKDGT
jgi:PAT family beta-lactamase induction signal transducer AmpG